MIPKHATKLANELLSRINLEDAPGPTERTAHVTRDAVIGAADLFIPDDAIGAVATREGAEGILVATDGKALYVIEAILPATDASPASAKSRLLNFDRTRDAVEHETMWRRPWGSVIRETAWRFTIADLTFEIEAKFDQDDEPPAQEKFAERLAVAMGWNFGGDARELEAAA